MLVKFTPVFQIPPCQLPEGSRELCMGRPHQLFDHCLAWEHGWSWQACGSVRALTVQCSVQPPTGSWGQSLWGYENNGTNTHLDALLFCSMKRFMLHHPWAHQMFSRRVLWLMLPAGWTWTKTHCRTSGTQMCLASGTVPTCWRQRLLPPSVRPWAVFPPHSKQGCLC